LDLYRGTKCVSGFMFKKEKQTSGRGVDKGFRLQKIPSLKPNVLLMKVPDNAFICYLPGSDSLPSSVRHFYGSSHFSATTNSSVSSLQSLDGKTMKIRSTILHNQKPMILMRGLNVMMKIIPSWIMMLGGHH
jgi:hypothetical protein